MFCGAKQNEKTNREVCTQHFLKQDAVKRNVNTTFYLRRLLCVVLFMIRYLSACDKSVLHICVIILSSVSLHITVSSLGKVKYNLLSFRGHDVDSYTHQSLENAETHTHTGCLYYKKGREVTSQKYFPYCIVGRLHCVVLLS